MTDTSPSWPTPALDDPDPRLILGDRPAPRRLAGRRIELRDEVFGDLRAIARRGLNALETSSPRPFEPYAALERREEYFWVSVEGLPLRPPPRRTGGEVEPGASNVDGTADLIAVTQAADQLDSIHPADVRASGYVFYEVCFPIDDGFIGFVKKSDPRRAVTAGRTWLGFDEDALTKVSQPELVLEQDVDLIVTPTAVAIFNPTAFKDLLADVRVTLETVPANIATVAASLTSKIPLTQASLDALQAAAQKRVSLARRLHDVAPRVAGIQLTPPKLRGVLGRQNVDPKRLLKGKSFSFDEAEAALFLDVLEGRYFKDELGDEFRRADRFSKRRD
jgi:hypothetical protein